MSFFTEVVKELLNKQYPDNSTEVIIVSKMTIRFISLPAKLLFQSYRQVKTLVLSHCDLRKLQNFPVFKQLKDLDLSNNSLQGTLNYLIPLQNLEYLNLSNNYISDSQKFQPLNRIKKVEIYIDKNPFTNTKNWKSKLRKINIKFLNKPKNMIHQKPKIIEKQQKQKSFQAEEKLQMKNGLMKQAQKVSFAQENLQMIQRIPKPRQKRQQVQGILFQNSSDNDEEQQQSGMMNLDYCLMNGMGLKLQQNQFQEMNSEQLQELQMQEDDNNESAEIIQSSSDEKSSY